MKAKDRVDKDTGTSRCFDSFGYSNQMYHLVEPVNEHKNNCILVWIYGESKDKVH